MLLSNICTQNNINLLNVLRHFSSSSCVFACGENVRRCLFIPYQKEPPKRTRKITVVGVGGVGRSVINALVRHPCSDEVLLLDLPEKKGKVCGEGLDYSHAKNQFPSPKITVSFNPEAAEHSDLIIITCGLPRKPEQKRRDLSQTNVDIMKKCIPPLAKCSPDAVFLIATNPIEAVTYAVWKYSKFPKNRVLGIGTSPDINRFKHYISTRIPINSFAIDAHVIGEHGDDGIPLWSTVNIAGTRFRDIDEKVGLKDDKNDWKEVWDSVKKAGSYLVKHKGTAGPSTGLLTATLAKDILQNSKNVRFVSIHAKGYLDIKTESFMTFPAVIGNRGVINILNMSYDQEDLDAIKKCANELDKTWKSIKF